jgi:hypothetical protein
VLEQSWLPKESQAELVGALMILRCTTLALRALLSCPERVIISEHASPHHYAGSPEGSNGMVMSG